jgi:hypothetical protein
VPLVSKSIPSLYNGISQQAPSIRHDSQAEEQVNCVSSLVRGLGRRPPLKLEYPFFLWDEFIDEGFVHFIDRDENEQYLVDIFLNGIYIFDIKNQTITIASDPNFYVNAYFNSGNPSTDWIALTVADTTILLNKSKIPAIKTSTTLGGALQGKKQRFTDLPATATNGHVWEITGDNTNAFDNYYVKGNGTTWEEWGRPGENFEIDPATMPIKLVRNSDGTWTVDRIAWSSRAVGDLASVPFPSFIGKRINDMFFFRNRFGFVAEENIIFSRAGDFFNFFPETVTAVLDSDPIDVAVTHSRISILNHAVPFDKSLLLFSDVTQFQVESGDALTPKAIQVHQTTEFECSRKVRPVAAGPNVYFASEKQSNSDILEYFAQDYVTSNDADNITAHVPDYVPKNIIKIATASNLDTLFFLSSDERNSIYVYKYYWKGDEKVQSSWSKWILHPKYKILGMGVIQSKLFLGIIHDDEGTSYLHIYSIELQEGVKHAGESANIYLDAYPFGTLLYGGVGSGTIGPEYQEGVYEAGLDRTLIFDFYEASYTPNISDIKVYKADGFPDDERGQELAYTESSVEAPGVTRYKWYIPGNHTDYSVYAGVKYTSSYEFSPQYPKDDKGTVLSQASMKLRRVRLNFRDTGAFTVKVTPEGRTPYTYTFVADDPLNTMTGKTFIETGTFSVPVMGDGKATRVRIESFDYKPFNFQSAEFEAFTQMRARRI